MSNRLNIYGANTPPTPGLAWVKESERGQKVPVYRGYNEYSNKKKGKLTIAVASVMGEPRVLGTGREESNKGASALSPIPANRP